MISSTSSNN